MARFGLTPLRQSLYTTFDVVVGDGVDADDALEELVEAATLSISLTTIGGWFSNRFSAFSST